MLITAAKRGSARHHAIYFKGIHRTKYRGAVDAMARTTLGETRQACLEKKSIPLF